MLKRITPYFLVMALMSTLAVAQVAQTGSVKVEGAVVEAIGQHWARINAGDSSEVRYGTDPQNLTQSAKAEQKEGQGNHRVTLKDLKPNTTYYYSSGSEHGQFTTTSFEADKIPIYRAYSSATGDHMYTTSYDEWRKSVRQGNYAPEGVVSYILRSQQAPNAVPLFRLFNPTTGDHFYTTNAQERGQAASSGYQDQGVAGYILASPALGAEPVYRLFNAQLSDHFYTMAQSEHDSALQKGYKDEGIVGYAWSR